MSTKAAALRTLARSWVAIDAITVAVLVAFVCLPVWPGIFTIDSQVMLWTARADKISNWYAPLLEWAWGLLDRIGIGPSGIFLLSVVAFVVAVLVLAKQFLQDGPARLATVGTILFPPVYGLLSWVGRDVWFATAALGITATVAHAHRRREQATLPWALAALALGVVAADSRQNGVPFAMLAVSVTAPVVVRRFRPQAGTALRAAAAVVGVGLFWAVLLTAQQAVISRNLHPEQFTYSRDLVAVSLDRAEPMLDSFLFPSQDVEALRSRLTGRGPEDAINLQPPALRFDPANDDVAKLWAQQWLRMVREHPISYGKSRVEPYGQLLGVTGPGGIGDRLAEQQLEHPGEDTHPKATKPIGRLIGSESSRPIHEVRLVGQERRK